MAAKGTIAVVGAGPGVGAAVARRFGCEGRPVGLLARNRERLEGVREDLPAEGIAAELAIADARDGR
ncbi:MAG: hypothetical protein U0R71_03030 [Solirubrobacterales bacterium]